MKLFRRGYEMTLNRVHDTVTIREGDEKITLTVNGDAMRMVAGLNKAQATMRIASPLTVSVSRSVPSRTVIVS